MVKTKELKELEKNMAEEDARYIISRLGFKLTRDQAIELHEAIYKKMLTIYKKIRVEIRKQKKW